MKRYEGTSACGGIVIGKLQEWKNCIDVPRYRVEALLEEENRFLKARGEALAQLEEDCKACEGLQEQQTILEAQKVLLADEGFAETVKKYIKEQQWNGEYAVTLAGDYYKAFFGAMEEDILRAKVEDVQDITDRILKEFGVGSSEEIKKISGILVTDEMTPGEMLLLDKEKIEGIVTRKGHSRSHSAIIAGERGIPMLIGVKAEENIQGRTAILDGEAGLLLVDPTEAMVEEYRERIRKEETEALSLLQNQKTYTKSGKEIFVFANASRVEEAKKAFMLGAEGIGLFRSESLFLGRKTPPAMEEQLKVYGDAIKEMGGREVVIRTFDLGGDKKVEYLPVLKEENQTYEGRGIRLALQLEDMFRTQLEAICRASQGGSVSIMFPMISSVWELQEAKKHLEEVRKRLDEETRISGKPTVGKISVGVMIETPEAVEISKELAGEVDFFSIGTNDLSYYLLGKDRFGEIEDGDFHSGHPKLLDAIRTITENAHDEGIKVSICGELAGDSNMTEILLSMGVDKLSVVPDRILKIKKTIMELA